MSRIVVVGAGLAAHRTVTGLRSQGFDGEIVVVGDEQHRPYDRPPLSKNLLSGAMTREQLFLPVDDLDVQWVLGTAAAGLDVAGHAVSLADGTRLTYDGAVIATGRRARPWPGDVPAGVHTLRSLDDTAALSARIQPESRVVIIGAGFIGCEVAATLRSLDVADVTIVDVAAHPMPVLGAEVGQRAAALHTGHGVRLRLSIGVESIDGHDQVESVTLTDGSVLPADIVLVATGSVPNSEWLVDADISLVSGAVRCAENCAVLDAGGDRLASVVAAGDIAAWPHHHADGETSIEHWSNARDMGALAASTLLGRAADPTTAPVPSFWSDQYNVKIKSAGYLRAADRYVVVAEDLDKPSLAVEAFRGDELVGAIVFNQNRKIIDYQRRLAAPGVLRRVAMTATRWAPPQDPTDADWMRWADDLPLCRAFGIVCTALDETTGKFVVAQTPLAANPNGSVNGGLVVAIADQVMGVMAIRGAPSGHTTATASLHTQFLAPAIAPLTNVARVLGGGRRLRFIEVTTIDHDGRPCAVSQGTMTIRSR